MNVIGRQANTHLSGDASEPKLSLILKEKGKKKKQAAGSGFSMAPEKAVDSVTKISHYTFDPSVPSLAAVREFVTVSLEPFETIRPLIPDIVSATHEACINSIVHNPDCDEMVNVTCRISKSSVVIEVSDKGGGLKDVKLPPSEPSPTSLAGRGLFIIYSLMDNVEAESSNEGTLLRMRKSCSL